jgi:iron complex transport system ATP-binding protein
MSEGAYLSAQDISFGWNEEEQPVLNSVSLEIARGQTLAILGPNGAGKTTLLSILSGRLRPRAGAVQLDGRPLASYSARERARHIAFLPQLEKLAFNYRVLDFVLMGRTPHMETLALPGLEDEAAAREALISLGMSAFEARSIGELSGGEFQLVRLARCLAQGASILFLDEPASMLDPAHARHIADALQALTQSGKTIIYTTHDIGLGIFLGGRALILGGSEVRWRGSAEQLRDPQMLAEVYGISFSIKELPSAF